MLLITTYLILCLQFQPLDKKTTDKIAIAIKKIENGNIRPYGIKSIRLKGKTREHREEYARQICLNSIAKNWERWNLNGRPGEFFEFMNQRYCPIDMNWSINLKSILRKRGFNFENIR